MIYYSEFCWLGIDAVEDANTAPAAGASASNDSGEVGARGRLDVEEESEDGSPLNIEDDLELGGHQSESESLAACDNKQEADYNFDPAPAVEASKRRKVPDGKGKASKLKPKKISAKQKLEYEKECGAWCAAHVWKEDSQYHQLHQWVRHKTDAVCKYGHKSFESKTLPFVAFENKYNPAQPGRSYCETDILVLLCRKMSMLEGLGGDLSDESFTTRRDCL